MSRKGKKVQTEKVEEVAPEVIRPDPHESSKIIDRGIVKGVKKYVEENVVKDEFDEIFPDDTDEVSLDDAARVLDVSVPVAKLWLLHGHMTSVGTKGFVRVSRESVRNCWKRFIAGRVR